MILIFNPKWFASSWIPESFQPLQADLGWRLKMNTLVRSLYLSRESQPLFWIRRLAAFVGLEELRYKVRYRWLNESVVSWVMEQLGQQVPPLNGAHTPFILDERREAAAPRADPPKEAMSEEQKKELIGIAMTPSSPGIQQIHFRALLEIISRARSRIVVVMISNDPGAIQQLAPALQKSYYSLFAESKREIAAAGIPVQQIDLMSEDYADYNHLSAAGHQKILEPIRQLCHAI
jgi:hypothetical protein